MNMLSKIKGFLGGSKVVKKILIMPQNVTIDVGPGQTLLEAALESGIAYPHDCTVGNCSSCKTRLMEGRVREGTPFGYTLSKQELDAGYILACQAFPRDELTVVEIPTADVELPVAKCCSAKIVRTLPLTHDILEVTVQADSPIDYVAGQYGNILAPGLTRHRSYSFAKAPLRGKGSCELVFFIRKVSGGALTDALFKGELDSVPLEFNGPHGNFYLRNINSSAPMICIAGGSGLAPLLSLLEDARNQRVRRPCLMLFGARTQADLYKTEVIRSLAENWPAPFKFVPVLSDEPAGSDWAGARGLVTDLIDFSIEPGSEGYLCGPPPMIDAAIAKLVEHGINIEDVFYDKFVDGGGAD